MNSALWIYVPLVLICTPRDGDGIYHGEEAEFSDFKYSAKLFIYEGVRLKQCGGGVIDEFHILTAAHCVAYVQPNQILILVGTANVRESSRFWAVEQIHVPPEYKSLGTLSFMEFSIRTLLPCIFEQPMTRILPKNDIAVLKIPRSLFPLSAETYRESTVADHKQGYYTCLYYGYPYDIRNVKLASETVEIIPLGKSISAVYLPESDFVPYCTELRYAAWGQIAKSTSTHRLQCTRLMIIEQEECFKHFSQPRNNTFCTISATGLSSVAPGDSGSPLIYENTVYGITSFICDGHPNVPAGFTKVFSYRDFIEDARKPK